MAAKTQMLASKVSQALQQGDRIGFVRAVTALIDARAPMVHGWKSLTKPLLDYGEFDLARRSISLYAAAMNETPAALFDAALIFTQTARPAEALVMLDRIGGAQPDRVSNAYLRGTIALNLGDHDTARESLLAAHQAKPTDGQILQTLSMIGSMASEPVVSEAIIAAAPKFAGAPDGDRTSFLYAVGKTKDDLGDIDGAFAAIAEAAALVAVERPYDAAVDKLVAVEATAGWSAAMLTTVQGRVGFPTDRPIIVTGLPRSGSTLVEQILVSHSAVADGDELGRFSLVVAEIGGADAASMDRYLQQRGPADQTRFYLHLLAQRFGKQGRVVDKTLEASRYLGTLAALMPDAPILWMRRDALDNAWSCFSTWFLAGLPWSWEQTALAAHMQLEDALLRQWQDILGDRLMVVDYQALVRAKETEIPRILSHCGLPDEPQVFSPEKTRRLVTTASMTQVRSPINTSAVDKGHRYRAYLQPFIDAYGYSV